MMKFRVVLAPVCAVALMLAAGAASAGDINNSTHLSNDGNTAVNNVKAKRWTQQGAAESGTDSDGNSYDASTDTLVHVGSAKKGDCTMNVGGVKDGKNTVVTAKNVINLCQ